LKQTFEIKGMDCEDCARKISSGVKKLNKVDDIQVNFATGKMVISGDVSAEEIEKRVRDLGYELADKQNEARPLETGKEGNFFGYLWQSTVTRLALIGAVLILPGLIFAEILGYEWWWVDALALLALMAAGLPVVVAAFRNLRINRSIDINFLMTIAATGAIFIGAIVEAGMVMVLFAMGEALEGFTAEKARHSIRSLMAVVPARATRLFSQEGFIQEEEVDIKNLRVGDHILVRPGERIPMDGVVTEGVSSVNQASITGESAMVPKAEGDAVFASTINGESALEICVTHLSEDNTISRVIHLVEEAQGKRARSQRFIDQFARWYTPAVVVLATLVTTIPPIFFNQPFLNPDDGSFGWLYRGLTLLVISCPCALVISTPVSIISAISNAARHGVLFKGGMHLEALAKVKVFAFDKTGTLTKGSPVIVGTRSDSHQEFKPISADCGECCRAIALAHAVERRSQHPLAQAIRHVAEELNADEKFAPASEVEVLPGLGVSGMVEGKKVHIGSHRMLDDGFQHSPEDCDQFKQAEKEGHTQIHVAVDGALVGSFLAVDAPRKTSRAALAALKEAGVKALVMLTGDSPMVAKQIAELVGVTEYRANLMPQDKVNVLAELRQKYGAVAMLGDGINDTPALAAADVGIAIGGAHSSAQALETADVTLMQADLIELPFAWRLSRRTMNVIHFNIAFAIGVKLLFMILAMLGLSTMWMAVVADVGISILVTLNGMRMLRFQ